jgi:hypothetical protein
MASGIRCLTNTDKLWERVMAELLIGNLEEGTTDDEVREFLTKYGFPAFDAIKHVPGAGLRPSEPQTFNELVQPRIQNMYCFKRLCARLMPGCAVCDFFINTRTALLK